MKPRTKKMLINAAAALLCALLTGGACLLMVYCFNTSFSVPEQESNGYKLLFYLIAAVAMTLIAGLWIHLLFLICAKKIHCPKCGVLGHYQNCKELKRSMASQDNVLSQTMLVTMQCPQCKQKYQFKKRFRVTRHGSDIARVTKYASGKCWF